MKNLTNVWLQCLSLEWVCFISWDSTQNNTVCSSDLSQKGSKGRTEQSMITWLCHRFLSKWTLNNKECYIKQVEYRLGSQTLFLINYMTILSSHLSKRYTWQQRITICPLRKYSVCWFVIFPVDSRKIWKPSSNTENSNSTLCWTI